jgi:hypothetical protein
MVLATGYFPHPEGASLRLADITRKGRDWRTVVSQLGRPTEILRVTNGSVVFPLPSAGGRVYGFRVDQPGEEPVFGRVNAPEIWWTISEATGGVGPGESTVTTDEVMPGATLRVFGRCLQIAGVAAELQPVANPKKKTGVAARAENEYSLAVTIPNEVEPGRYILRVAASTEALTGGGAERTIEIRRGMQAAGRSLSIADFGGQPQNGIDNSAALGRALAAAQAAGGATVELPAGGYFFAQPIEIPPHVTLRGAGPDQTAIYFAETEAAPEAWIHGTHDFGVENVSIFCANHKAILSSDMSGKPEGAGHVLVRNVRIRGSMFRGHPTSQSLMKRVTPVMAASGVGFETVRLSGPDLRILDCDLLGSSRSVYIYRGKGAVVRGNRIQNGFRGWYNFNASEEVIFEGNTISGADLESTGGSYSTWGPPKSSQNFYTANNNYSQMMGWDREAFTSDGGGGAYYGKATQTKAGRLELDAASAEVTNVWQGAVAAIIEGRGMGQWRVVADASGHEVQLAAPFEIAPDNTSVITIVPAQVHYLFFHNHYSESGYGIAYYGTAIEHIAEGNEVAEAGGIFASSRRYSGGVSPEFGLQFIGNTIGARFNYVSSPYGATTFDPSAIDAFSVEPGRTIGLVLRRNRFLGQSVLRIRSQTPAGMRAVLVDGNQLAGGTAAMEIDKNAAPEVVVR